MLESNHELGRLACFYEVLPTTHIYVHIQIKQFDNIEADMNDGGGQFFFPNAPILLEQYVY